MPLPEPTPPSVPPPNSTPSRPLRSELTRELLQHHVAPDAGMLKLRIARSSSWFYWIAVLSLVNSLLSIFGGSISFLAGLAVVQIMDVFAAHLGPGRLYYSLAVNLVVSVVVCSFGYLSGRGSKAALLTGMALYALDALVFLPFHIYAPALFHAFVLYQIYSGWRARRELDQLRAESPTLVEMETDKSRPPRLY